MILINTLLLMTAVKNKNEQMRRGGCVWVGEIKEQRQPIPLFVNFRSLIARPLSLPWFCPTPPIVIRVDGASHYFECNFFYFITTVTLMLLSLHKMVLIF